MPVTFFNPAADLPLPPWAAQSQWTPQADSSTTTRQRATALDATGNETASALHNTLTTRTLTLVSTQAEGFLALPAIGAIIDTDSLSWHLDSLTLALTPADWPTLTLTLHTHAPRRHTPCRTFAPTLKIPAGRGIPPAPAGFSATDLGTGITAFTYHCQTTHVDATDGAGDHLAADNHRGLETVSLTLTGDSDLTAPPAWDRTQLGQTAANTTHNTLTATYLHPAPMV